MFLGRVEVGEIEFSAAEWRELPEVAASQGAVLYGNRKRGRLRVFFSRSESQGRIAGIKPVLNPIQAHYGW